MSEEYKLIGIYNRQPKNPNELLENKFVLDIRKLPETTFKCRTANIPGTTLPYAIQHTQLNPIPRPGLNLEYQPLEIEFIVDEDLNNYRELYDWIRQLGIPINNLGYTELKLRGFGPEPDRGLVSDIILTILTNEFEPNILIFYRNSFPISLGEVRFSNNTDNPNTQVATAKFIYDYFEIMGTEEDDVGHSLP